LMVILQIGKFATLLQKPDIVFLLPHAYRINDYLIKARHHSMTMTALIQIGCGLITVPFLVRVLHFKWLDCAVLLISQVLFKWMQLLFEETGLFDQKWNSSQMQILKQGLPLIGIAAGIVLSPCLSLGIAVIGWGSMFQLRKKASYHVFKWKDAIAAEDKRVMRSEERRVGKECRSRWARDQEKKKEKKVNNGWKKKDTEKGRATKK